MRTIWKGSISFGLVNIPVKMYTASQAKEISFVLLHKKDLSEIRYAKMCKSEEKEVPWEDIVKGYEVENGEFVVFDDKDFEKVNVKKTKTIEILNFVDQDEIDSVYYVKPYYLEPEKNGEKAYGLLRDALNKSKKVALAQYVIRNREHIGVLKFHDNMIVLNELRYSTELLSAEDLKIPENVKTNPKEINMAIQLIDQLSASFTPKKYKDTYTEEVKQVIKQKAKGKKIQPETEEAPSHKIHDIMSLLQQSLEKKPSKKQPKSA
jgi:DNA end-binding protein Ku